MPCLFHRLRAWLTAKKETQEDALARLRADLGPPPPPAVALDGRHAPDAAELLTLMRQSRIAIPRAQVDWAAGADATVVYYVQVAPPPGGLAVVPGRATLPATGPPVTTGQLLIPGIDHVGVFYDGLTVTTTPCRSGHRQYQFRRLIAPDAVLTPLLARLACRRVPYLILEPADGTPAVRLNHPWASVRGTTIRTGDRTIRSGDLRIVERLTLVAIPHPNTPPKETCA